MKILNTLAFLAVLYLATGCTNTQRDGRYRTAPPYGTVSRPPVVRPATPAPAAPVISESDRALATAVREQFYRYGELGTLSRQITVNARSGAVTLEGTVPTEQDRRVIATIVQNTPGVVTVNDRLRVSGLTGTTTGTTYTPPGVTYTESDRLLMDRVRQALRDQPALAGTGANLQVSAQNGTVTLTGNVPTEEDRRFVESVVRNTTGVLGVNNHLALTATGRTSSATSGGDIFNLHVQGLNATDRALAQQVLEGLRTDTMLASLLPVVNIHVADGRAILQGTVQNDQQRRAIVSIVQRAAGANNVVYDELQVLPR